MYTHRNAAQPGRCYVSKYEAVCGRGWKTGREAGQEVASVTGLNSAEVVFLIASLQESDLEEYTDADLLSSQTSSTAQ